MTPAKNAKKRDGYLPSLFFCGRSSGACENVPDAPSAAHSSDFISLHAPAVDGGALVSAETIAKMKDGVVIINTSRGSNVDEDALLAALESGKVRAAGLDVYVDEPTKNKALYRHPMVSCTPHIGAATVEAQKRIGAEIVEIIKAM